MALGDAACISASYFDEVNQGARWRMEHCLGLNLLEMGCTADDRETDQKAS